MEAWRDTVATEGCLRRQQLGLKAPKAEGDLFVSGSEVLCPSRGAAAEKRSSNACRVGGDTRYCVSTPLTSHLDRRKVEAEDEREHGGAECRVQSASHAGPCTCAITRVDQRASNSSKLWQLSRKAQHTRFTFAGIATIKRRAKQGEAEANGVCWKALVEQKSSFGKEWAAFGVDELQKLGSVWCG